MPATSIVQTFASHEDVAAHVGDVWRRRQNDCDKEFFIAAPLSATSIPLFEWVLLNWDSFTNWDKMRFVLMDEQIESLETANYVSIDDTASYEGFARKRLLDPLSQKVSIDLSTRILKPDLGALSLFDEKIESHHGIDLLILAIGVGGHYAQVMPGVPIDMGFHTCQLMTEVGVSHTQKGSKSYEGAKFREFGMSLGPKQVLSAKQIVVVITGSQKRGLAKQLFEHHTFDPDFPLTIIFHPSMQDKVSIILSDDCLPESVGGIDA